MGVSFNEPVFDFYDENLCPNVKINQQKDERNIFFKNEILDNILIYKKWIARELYFYFIKVITVQRQWK